MASARVVIPRGASAGARMHRDVAPCLWRSRRRSGRPGGDQWQLIKGYADTLELILRAAIRP